MKNVLKVFLFFISLLFSVALNAQITGFVFQDFNGNGIKDNIAETANSATMQDIAIAGVVINAYNNADVLIAQQVTNTLGSFIFPIGVLPNQLPINTAVRLEYVLPQNCIASSSFMNAGMGGNAYGSNVQFRTQKATPEVTNFALFEPSKFRDNVNNPRVFTPRLTSGDPLISSGGNAAQSTAFYSFNYTASARNTTGNSSRTSLATAEQIGSCWGVAYNKFNTKIYTSALIKRHSGLGPGGPVGNPNPDNAPGSVYEINPSIANSGKFFFSMDALGAAYYTHDHTIGNALHVKNNPARNLVNNIGVASADATTFDQVGKVGVGDIELSDDGRFLWLTNLFNQKLYRIDLTSGNNPIAPTVSTAPTLIKSWSLPSLSATSGIIRPWGIKFYHNKVYVGVVSSGENDINANSTAYVNTNLDGSSSQGGSFNVGNAYVLEFDQSGIGSWATKLTIPLNYPRGNAADEDFNIKRWFNWANTSSVYTVSTNGSAQIKPQPILSNIEFDVEGSMMIAFMDRLSNQTGLSQFNEQGTGSYYGEAGGDLLRAYNNGCENFELESNGKEGPSSPKPATAGANHGQGPGSGPFSTSVTFINDPNYGSNYGEFYFKERFVYSPTFLPHNETNLGGLAFLPGSNEVMSTNFDIYDINTNGILRSSNNSGDSTGGYEIIPYSENGTFAKAASLGDIELITSIPPIEIGNRTWSDANNDGIQGADENGIAGIVLELCETSTNIVIGTVTTNINGSYYFSSASGTNIVGVTYNLNIKPFTNYKVRLATSGVGNSWNPLANNGQGSPRLGSPLVGLDVTNYASIGNGITGQSDNDAIIINGLPQASVTTGDYGKSIHNVDIGFKPAAPVTSKMISFTANPNVNTVDLNWTVVEQTNVKKYEVEFSKDAITFTKISETQATLNQREDYNLNHINPVNGINYYRIKTVDNNRTYVYSNIRRVEFSSKLDIKTYPNPATDYLYISLPTANINKPIAIVISNIIGKEILRIHKTKASQTEEIDLQNLIPGSYLLKIECGNDKINKIFVVTK